jgi:hypothetical protein
MRVVSSTCCVKELGEMKSGMCTVPFAEDYWEVYLLQSAPS